MNKYNNNRMINMLRLQKKYFNTQRPSPKNTTKKTNRNASE